VIAQGGRGCLICACARNFQVQSSGSMRASAHHRAAQDRILAGDDGRNILCSASVERTKRKKRKRIVGIAL
jgi:hypothetical protein